MDVLRLESVEKTYPHRAQGVTALTGVDLKVEKGEFVTITGPSGSGKTTLLLTMGGLIHPTRGKVLVDGVPVYDVPVKERSRLRLGKIGFLFQTFNLIPYLTAEENVSVPLHLTGMDKDRQRARSRELLERFGLGDRLSHKPSELSIGQQQRVALARALANDPELILADEPTGNLDPATTDEVMAAFRDLTAKGKTLVMVTHSDCLAGQGTRRLVLTAGRIATSEECRPPTVRRIGS